MIRTLFGKITISNRRLLGKFQFTKYSLKTFSIKKPIFPIVKDHKSEKFNFSQEISNLNFENYFKNVNQEFQNLKLDEIKQITLKASTFFENYDEKLKEKHLDLTKGLVQFIAKNLENFKKEDSIYFLHFIYSLSLHQVYFKDLESVQKTLTEKAINYFESATNFKTESRLYWIGILGNFRILNNLKLEKIDLNDPELTTEMLLKLHLRLIARNNENFEKVYQFFYKKIVENTLNEIDINNKIKGFSLIARGYVHQRDSKVAIDILNSIVPEIFEMELKSVLILLDSLQLLVELNTNEATIYIHSRVIEEVREGATLEKTNFVFNYLSLKARKIEYEKISSLKWDEIFDYCERNLDKSTDLSNFLFIAHIMNKSNIKDDLLIYKMYEKSKKNFAIFSVDHYLKSFVELIKSSLGKKRLDLIKQSVNSVLSEELKKDNLSLKEMFEILSKLYFYEQIPDPSVFEKIEFLIQNNSPEELHQDFFLFFKYFQETYPTDKVERIFSVFLESVENYIKDNKFEGIKLIDMFLIANSNFDLKDNKNLLNQLLSLNDLIFRKGKEFKNAFILSLSFFEIPNRPINFLLGRVELIITKLIQENHLILKENESFYQLIAFIIKSLVNLKNEDIIEIQIRQRILRLADLIKNDAINTESTSNTIIFEFQKKLISFNLNSQGINIDIMNSIILSNTSLDREKIDLLRFLLNNEHFENKNKKKIAQYCYQNKDKLFSLYEENVETATSVLRLICLVNRYFPDIFNETLIRNIIKKFPRTKNETSDSITKILALNELNAEFADTEMIEIPTNLNIVPLHFFTDFLNAHNFSEINKKLITLFENNYLNLYEKKPNWFVLVMKILNRYPNYVSNKFALSLIDDYKFFYELFSPDVQLILLNIFDNLKINDEFLVKVLNEKWFNDIHQFKKLLIINSVISLRIPLDNETINNLYEDINFESISDVFELQKLLKTIEIMFSLKINIRNFSEKFKSLVQILNRKFKPQLKEFIRSKDFSESVLYTLCKIPEFFYLIDSDVQTTVLKEIPQNYESTNKNFNDFCKLLESSYNTIKKVNPNEIPCDIQFDGNNQVIIFVKINDEFRHSKEIGIKQIISKNRCEELFLEVIFIFESEIIKMNSRNYDEWAIFLKNEKKLLIKEKNAALNGESESTI